KANLLSGWGDPAPTDLKRRIRRRHREIGRQRGDVPRKGAVSRYGGCRWWRQLFVDARGNSVKEDRPMIRLVVFLAIGVMGFILVRVRRQRKTRTVMPAAE